MSFDTVLGGINEPLGGILAVPAVTMLKEAMVGKVIVMIALFALIQCHSVADRQTDGQYTGNR